MSGIFGVLGRPGGDRSREIVGAMADTLRRRPWHLTETSLPEADAALGRQSIGVFNRLPQPVQHAAGVSLWLCGEFYHQRERRGRLASEGRLDGEAPDEALALAVYERDGIEGLTALEGAFAIAVWDRRTRTFVFVNDRFGSYPHLYAHTGGGLTLAPDLETVCCNPAVSRALDRTTVAQFVRFQQALGDRTWLQGVRLLPPASQLVYRPDDDALDIRAYWDWDRIGRQPSITFDDAVDGCIGVFQRAVDAMTAPPARPGIFLSGGLDGRAILGFARPDAALATITYGAAGCRDVVLAERLSRAAGRPHHWFPFRDGSWVETCAPLHVAITSGLHGWYNAHGLSVLPQIRGLMDVNLSGYDGGTVLGGSLDFYRDRPYREAPDPAALAASFFDAFCTKFTWPGLTDDEARALFAGESRDLFRRAPDSLRDELARVTDFPPGRQADFFYHRHALARALQYQVVVQRSAIEVRCPFFDYALIDFIYSLPDRIRTTPMFRRTVLTRRMPKLARIPHEKTNLLPHASPWVYYPHAFLRKLGNRINRHIAPVFVDRPRLYADYENYLRRELRPWAEDLLLGPRAAARGLFDPAAVRSLWERHLAGGELWTIGKVGPLISIELALRRFIDSEKRPAA
ncbi:MAG TPA: asparagine synthase-related protein [Vicinamibacterales bacterium]|nr:asparagine synthase-related protein [Vicinamibacterales bacterium]HPK70406.1 asparagine synthase-related protein [Vicinamibacterales bacterium]